MQVRRLDLVDDEWRLGADRGFADVADRYPNTTVTGVDLYPPPQTFVPPNCVLEVDDAT